MEFARVKKSQTRAGEIGLKMKQIGEETLKVITSTQAIDVSLLEQSKLTIRKDDLNPLEQLLVNAVHGWRGGTPIRIDEWATEQVTFEVQSINIRRVDKRAAIIPKIPKIVQFISPTYPALTNHNSSGLVKIHPEIAKVALVGGTYDADYQVRAMAIEKLHQLAPMLTRETAKRLKEDEDEMVRDYAQALLGLPYTESPQIQ